MTAAGAGWWSAELRPSIGVPAECLMHFSGIRGCRVECSTRAAGFPQQGRLPAAIPFGQKLANSQKSAASGGDRRSRLAAPAGRMTV